MKGVSFNIEKNTVHDTYAVDEYDRCSIDSTLYLRCLKRIDDCEWMDILKDLNIYTK